MALSPLKSVAGTGAGAPAPAVGVDTAVTPAVAALQLSPSLFPLYYNTDEESFLAIRASRSLPPVAGPSHADIAKTLLESFGLDISPGPTTNAGPIPKSQSSTPAPESVPHPQTPTASPIITTKAKTATPMGKSWADIAATTKPSPKSVHKPSASPASAPSHRKQLSQSSIASVPEPSQRPQSQLPEEPRKVSPQPDLEPAVELDASVQPLGIILLRIMFDKAFLTNTIKNKKVDLVVPHGLNNSGNICYMNSILQFLFACQPFSQMLNIIREQSIAQLKDNTTPILDALLLLHAAFKKKQSADGVAAKVDVIDPIPFYKSIAVLPRFSHLQWGRQEDAEEFLGHLLDELHEEFIREISKLSMDTVRSFADKFHNKDLSKRVVRAVEFIKDENTESQFEESGDGWKEIGANRKPSEKRTMEVKYSPIVTLFGGQFKSVLKMGNKKSSITLDPFMQVQLDIDDKDITDLQTAFLRFASEEEINMGKSTATKQNFIDKVPSVLIIQLKRFSFVTYELDDDEESSFSEVVSKSKKKNSKPHQASPPTKAKKFDCRIEKIRKFISYPHQFTLPQECISNSIQDPPLYELVGVVYHHGRDTENGHYTVESKDSHDEWIKIDDTSIIPITENDAVSDKSNISKTAYILMYNRL